MSLFLDAGFYGLADGFDGLVGVGILTEVDRRAYVHMDRMAAYDPCALGHHIVATAERYGYDRQGEVECYLEGATLEAAERAVLGARSLGEDDGAYTIDQLLLYQLDTLYGCACVLTLNEDMSSGLAGDADEGYATQFGLHEPLEDDGQPAVDDPYVVHRLMVAHEDVGLTGLDILESGDRHGQEHESAHAARPELLLAVHELGIAPGIAYDGEHSREDGQQDGYRPGYQILIQCKKDL